MRKLFREVHKWLSIPVGLIITVICLTGAILVYEKEILELYYPERYFVEDAGRDPISLDKLIPIINQQLDTNSVASVRVSSDPKETYRVSLEKGFRVTAFVDQYTGKVTGVNQFRESFFFKIMSLHRWLMDGTRTWGKYTTGITTILFVFILISGIVIWAPKTWNRWKGKFTVKTSNGRKRLFYDLHTVLGIYACLFLLVCSLTGLMWSFEWYRNGVYRILGAEVRTEAGGHHHGGGRRGGGEKKEKPEQNILHWQEALDSFNKDYVYANVGDGTITVLSKSAVHQRAMDEYAFDAKTGAIRKADLYADRKLSAKIMGWAYVIHVGAYCGQFFRFLTFLACIIGASLPLTGYYIYFVKLNKKSKKK